MRPRNIMEIVIEREIKNNKDSLNLVCDCEQCLADVFAITLNQFPPKYIVNDYLEPYIRVGYEMMQQGRAQILTEIIHAVNKVGEHPRCDNFKNNFLSNCSGQNNA